MSADITKRVEKERLSRRNAPTSGLIYVFAELTRISELFVASIWTRKQNRLMNDALVSHSVSTPLKPHIAKLALVFFLSRVQGDVLVVSLLAPEALPANFTRERLLFGVNSLVLQEIVILGHNLRAEPTEELLTTWSSLFRLDAVGDLHVMTESHE